MNTVTHALLPVLAAGVYNRSQRLVEERRGVFSPKQLIAIGLFGAAPDLLNPHLSLDDRYSSWSHGVLFWAFLTIGLIAFRLARSRPRAMYMALWLSGAYLFHMFCDAISGGVAWLYPLGGDIVGAYYIEPIWWIPLDVICCLFAYGLFRAIPGIRRSRIIKSG